MKVLHLPYNIGSKITLTVAALRNIGIDAKGIAINNRFDEGGENVFVFNPRDYSYFNPKKYFKVREAYAQLYRWISWADVVHWYYDFKVMRSEKILNRIRLLNKPAVIEWAGSEIRIPEILSSHNSYYKKSYAAGYSYKFESLNHSRLVQKKFRDAGFEALVRPELEEFIQQDIYPNYYKVNNRIHVKQYVPAYPSAEKKNPLMVHPVTARGAKGTSFVLDAVNQLKQKYKFDFLLLENLSHQKTIEQLVKADIVIDQLILGAFGTTSLEGMALGKPVVCYISDKLNEKLPSGNPFVNANPDTIYSVLKSLITNPKMRNETGIPSRKFVEEHHDAEVIAYRLKNIYEEVLSKKQTGR